MNEIKNPVFMIKMISGEEILAEVILSSNEENIVIKNPFLAITDIDMDSGTHSLVLLPWIAHSLFKEPQIIKLNSKAIAYQIELMDTEMLDYYHGVVYETYDSIVKVVDSTTKKLSELDDESKKNIVSITRKIKSPKSPVTN